MNMRIVTVLVLLLFAAGVATANGGSIYDSQVTLENKNSSWGIIDDEYSVTVEYNSSGEEFEWHAYGNVKESICYALIYYADKPDRFSNTQWGGDNPGALIADLGVCSGAFDHHGSTEMNMNMPMLPDANIEEYNYTESDGYIPGCGAKLWLVPCVSYDATACRVTSWEPTRFMFETGLIWYDDTGVNITPRIDEISIDCEVNAGDTVEICATVVDYDGVDDLIGMNVTADFSGVGIEEPVTLYFDGIEDCVTAVYCGSVQVNKSTCRCQHSGGWNPDLYCDDVNIVVNVTDTSGKFDESTVELMVKPGPCDHMGLVNYNGPYDNLRTIALTHDYTCDTCPVLWWCYDDIFDIYMLDYDVHVYDEFDNCIGLVEDAYTCCDRNTVTLSEGSTVSMKAHLRESRGNHIVMVNEGEPGKTTMTVHCISGDGDTPMPDLIQEIEFLESVQSLEVTSLCDRVLVDECSTCCEVTTQLLDVNGEPILMPRVPVDLFVGDYEWTPCYEGPENTLYTDENGTVTVCVYMNPGIEDTEVNIRAEAECRAGNLSIPVVPGPSDLDISFDAEFLTVNDSCGECDNTIVTIQLLNETGVPYQLEGYGIDVFMNGLDQEISGCEPHEYDYETDENGIVEFMIDAIDEEGTIPIYIEGQCVYGETSIEVVPSELTELELVAVEPIMIPFLPDDEQQYEVHCYNQRGLEMCCPCSMYEFAVDNKTVATWDYKYGSSNRLIRNNLTALAIGETDVNISCEGLVDNVSVTVSDPCENVVCDGTMCDYDTYELYNMTCFDGKCVQYMVIETNCPECGYVPPDPCEDVVCPNECFGFDLYSQICVDGTCIQGTLIEANSYDCGYVPPGPDPDPCDDVVCDGTICVGDDLYNMHCVDGKCVAYQWIVKDCPACMDDPCEDVVCDGTRCIGYNLYDEVCIDGVCVPHTCIEVNSAQCGYVPPDDDPCEDIECTDTICNGTDLYNMTCEDGVCVEYMIVEENCVACGYVPPDDDPCEDVTCEDKCFGYDLWSQICEDGVCVNDTLIEANCADCGYVPPDDGDNESDELVCDEFTCIDGVYYNMTYDTETEQCIAYLPIEFPTVCNGTDLYNTTCDNGTLVQNMLIEKNCPECGYVAPVSRYHGGGGGGGGTYPPEPTPTSTPDDDDVEPTPEPTKDIEEILDAIIDEYGDDINETELEEIKEKYGDETGTGPTVPGFTGVFAIAAVLGMMYLIARRREQSEIVGD